MVADLRLHHPHAILLRVDVQFSKRGIAAEALLVRRDMSLALVLHISPASWIRTCEFFIASKMLAVASSSERTIKQKDEWK